MDFHEVKQRLLIDGVLGDIQAIYHELSGFGLEQKAAEWEALRSALESNELSGQWSPWIAHLVAYVDQVPADERLRVLEHQESLLDEITAQLVATYQAEGARPLPGVGVDAVDAGPAEPATQRPAFTADGLWSALSAEMVRKAGMGDVPPITGSARAVARKLVEVAWYAALGQHTASDALDTWVHRCLETAQRNIGVDLSRPEALEVLRTDTGGAFAALRRAAGPIADSLAAAAAEQKDRARRPASRKAQPAPDDDPLDGASLRILFGEADIETIQQDDELWTAFQDLVRAGLELSFKKVD
jgi:hypothetical protein